MDLRKSKVDAMVDNRVNVMVGFHNRLVLYARAMSTYQWVQVSGAFPVYDSTETERRGISPQNFHVRPAQADPVIVRCLNRSFANNDTPKNPLKNNAILFHGGKRSGAPVSMYSNKRSP